MGAPLSVRWTALAVLFGFVGASQWKNVLAVWCAFEPSARTAVSMWCNFSGVSEDQVWQLHYVVNKNCVDF